MPADRFFVAGTLYPSLALTGAEFHHLKVMRINPGEEIEVVNGKGAFAKAIVHSIDKQRAQLDLSEIQQQQPQPASFILGIPFMRPSKLEWILEKGTEIGVDAFYLYPAEHSEKLQLSDHQLERFQHVTVSALKQSGRLFLPSLEILASFKELFATEGTHLYGDVTPQAPNLLHVKLERTVLFMTGPERGFSAKEVDILQQKAQGVSLSPHILRAETAPIVAASVLSLLKSPR